MRTFLSLAVLGLVCAPSFAQLPSNSQKEEEKPKPVGLIANQNAATMASHLNPVATANATKTTTTKTTITRTGSAVVPHYGYGYPVPYPVPVPVPAHGYPHYGYPNYGYPAYGYPQPGNTLVGAPLTQPSFAWEKPAYATSIPLGARYYGGYLCPPTYCPPPGPVYYPPYPHYGYGYNQSSSVSLSVGNSNFRLNVGSTVRR